MISIKANDLSIDEKWTYLGVNIFSIMRLIDRDSRASNNHSLDTFTSLVSAFQHANSSLDSWIDHSRRLEAFLIQVQWRGDMDDSIRSVYCRIERSRCRKIGYDRKGKLSRWKGPEEPSAEPLLSDRTGAQTWKP